MSFRAWRVARNAIACLLLVFGPGDARAEPELRVVEVQPGESVRDLAAEHLGNADLWRDLLVRNGLAAASDVVPGMELRVPDLPIAEARAALAESLAEIQAATALGASVFASEILGRAVARREAALRDGKAGRWGAVLEAAGESTTLAREARELTKARREASGEAVLAARRGQVQGRRAEALTWTERPVDSILVENERVRTLSGSFAEVLFSDRSQIRLGENAQAVIQSMQIDRLNDRRHTSVSLVEGDAFALLGGGGTRDFDVTVESVDARIDSKNFWVRREGEEAKFANYDERPVKVSSGADEVTLGWNQGTVVSADRGPAEPKDLLPPPRRLGPPDGSAHHRETVLLQWEPVDGAASYAVEVDRDSRFGSPVVSAGSLPTAAFAASGLGRGVYSWRVRAIDALGFPGAPSGAGRFRVEAEGRAPFLAVAEPAADGPTGVRTLVLRGETEPSASLAIDGVAVSLDEQGRFAVSRTLRAGRNEIVFEATSPAGLPRRVVRTLEYLPGWFAPIEYDPALARLGEDHFVTRSESLTLSGTTLPDATVDVLAEGRSLASARSRSNGRFQLAVPLHPGPSALRIRVTSDAGFATEEAFTATRDSTPPRLFLPRSVPVHTEAGELLLTGRIEPGARLEVDGVPVETDGTKFRAPVPLAPGTNTIRLAAVDAAGNRTERTIRVARDAEPPHLEETAWIEDDAGNVRGLRVVADDPAGLRRFATYRLVVGGEALDGVLRLAPDGRTYVGWIPGPEPRVDEATLEYVEVQDRVGNRRRHP